MRRLKIAFSLCLLLAAVTVLAACGSDSRDTGPVSTIEAGPVISPSGGSTTIDLDPISLGVLSNAGVSVEAIKPAKLGPRGIVLPIIGGDLTSGTLVGKIEHEGGIAIVAGGRRVAYGDLTVDTAVGQVFAGADEATPILNLDTRRLKRSEDGTDVVVRGIRALIASGASEELNTGLQVSAFKPEQVIGEVTIRVAGP